jgi:hypothetical protein
MLKSERKSIMKIFYLLVVLLSSPLAFAHHFTGSYQAQNGLTITIQHGADGQMQGILSGNGQQFQLQGYGDQQGAQGQIVTPQGTLMFQAQVSQDLNILQMTLMQVDSKGQPLQNTAQQLSFQRVNGSNNPSAPNNPMPVPAPSPNPVNPVPTPGPMPTPVPAPNPVPANPLAPNPNPMPTPPMPTGADDWSGVYQSQALVMTLQGANGTYTGVFEVNGQKIPFQAQGDMAFLQGTIQSTNGATPFQVGRDGDTAYVYVADTEYILIKQSNSGQSMPANNPLGH